MRYFNQKDAAVRYSIYRPKVHDVVIDWIYEATGKESFLNAIDIGCGTGDSLKPLYKIAKSVIGIDTSTEMLEIACNNNLNVTTGSYENIKSENTYDLISTCMAFHWFDQELAIKCYKRISQKNAIWIIYNFAFSCHEKSEKFNKWFFDYYLTKYPSPPRKKTVNAIPENDSEIEMLRSDKGIIPITFDKEKLIGYLSTQSNIEAAVKKGRSYEDITQELLKQIKNIDISGFFNYKYTYNIYKYIG